MSTLAASCTNISIFPCDHSTCKLQHTATMADWVAHFIQANAAAFASADVVLIERQPPGGLRCCEQLIFEHFRAKAKLLQPRSMHSFFNMGCMNYEERKKHSVYLASVHYPTSPILQAALDRSRAHDITDAMLMAVYYKDKLNPHPREEVKLSDSIDAFFSSFYYNKSK